MSEKKKFSSLPSDKQELEEFKAHIKVINDKSKVILEKYKKWWDKDKKTWRKGFDGHGY